MQKKKKTKKTKPKTLSRKYRSTPIFIPTLFTVTNIQKQLKCPINRWMDKEDVIVIHTHTHAHTHTPPRVLFSYNKERNLAICSNMDEPRGYYANWNNSDRERQVLYDFTYM